MASELNYGQIESLAQKLNANAIKSATKVIDGQRYILDFVQGRYEVSDANGEYVVTFNTRKVTEAKKWLAEYLGY